MCLSKNFFVKLLHRIRTKIPMFDDLLDLMAGYSWDKESASKVCQAKMTLMKGCFHLWL